MSKDKVIINKPDFQRQHLYMCAEPTTKLKIECCHCSHEDEQEIGSGSRSQTSQIVKWYKEGWRYAESENYATVGPVCPSCMKNELEPDEDDWKEVVS